MKTISRYIMTLALLITAATGAWAEDTYTITFAANGNTVTKENVTLPKTFSCNFDNVTGRGTDELDLIIQELYGLSEGCCGTSAPNSDNASVTCNVDKANNQYIIVSAPFNGTATVTGRYADSDFMEFDYTLEISFPGYVAPFEVTTNAASEGATFTEAWFNMPAYDATAEYELVRDMSVQMTVKVGEEGEDGFRIRVKKNEQQQFEPAEMQFDAMLALFTVNDEIEEKTLTFYGQTVDCKLSIFAVDENGEPTGDAITFNALTPGRYVAIATAADGSAYDGETGPSNIFELYQGYEVEIPAGEMITYYKDEAIYVEDEDVQLFSITAVGENTATATQFDVIPANKAMLVKNNSAEPKTVLLIPTETDPLSFTWYDGFVGTLEATTILASDATTDRYAFNGKQFVRVKNDLAVGANKAWLEIPAANNARIINISFEETTGIHGTNWANEANGSWYDLNGRKLDAVPTKKGVYILNGKKVVVK